MQLYTTQHIYTENWQVFTKIQHFVNTVKSVIAKNYYRVRIHA